MKTRRIIAALAALALVAVGCKSVNPVTTITGEVLDGVEDVYVYCPSVGVDTTCTAVDGVFTVDVPTCLVSTAYLECGNAAIQLIPDGTVLTVDFEAQTALSNKPGRSVQERLNRFSDYFAEFNQEYNDKVQSIYYDEEKDEDTKLKEMQDFADEKLAQLQEYLVALLKKNGDNFIGAIAFQNLVMMADGDAELKEYIALLSEEVRQIPDIAQVEAAIATRENTGEGSYFIDFAVDCVTGLDKNGDPVIAPKCFSDYVGNGKYVLVDFWASWCAPCRAEIPSIAAVYEKYAGEKFDVLGIAVWDEYMDTFDAIEEEVITWNQMVLAENDRTVPADTYGIQSIPQIMLFGPDGTIVARNLRGDAIEAAVEKVLL